MSEITLAYLARPTTGGWVSYTAHLARGLMTAGHKVTLAKLGKRSEAFSRDFGMGLRYANTSAAVLDTLARRGELIITAADKSVGPSLLAELRDAGAAVVIHDPTELKGGMRDALDHGGAPLWVVRRSMLKHLPHAVYAPHPYTRASLPEWKGRRYHAMAFSRLDWDKHTDLIVRANQILLPDPERRVRIYGTENRLYTHHKLTAIDPDWRANYAGPMARVNLWAGALVARRATWAVDLSVIKGDGGGTQYTFLEALDAGARLIINSAWLTSAPALDEMALYVSAAVSDAESLAEVLSGPADAYAWPDATPLFYEHDAQRVASRMAEELHP